MRLDNPKCHPYSCTLVADGLYTSRQLAFQCSGAHSWHMLCRFKAEINFDGPKLIERYMLRHDEARIQQSFAAAAVKADPADLQALLKEYGAEIVSSVGAEVRCCSVLFSKKKTFLFRPSH